MEAADYDIASADIAWCPGCGNFAILQALKAACAEIKKDPKDIMIVSGIGQAAKLPQYIRCNMFNGLHGRALPAATGIKAANRELTVIAASGDGDMYGEGGNHFIHAIRRNPDIVNMVHNNMIYGLTKGQASPTTGLGKKTAVHIDGVKETPFNPLAVAITLDASFVARASAPDIKQTTKILRMAMQYKGYALIDILQPCVTFNKENSYEWLKNKTYYLDDRYDPRKKEQALKKAFETQKLPLGVLYVSKKKKTFEETLACYSDKEKSPLYKRTRDQEDVLAALEGK